MSEWKTYRLGDLCDSISNTYRGKAQNVVLINTSDVLEGKCLNHRKEPNKNLKGQFKKTFQQGDILYSEIRPSNKRFAYIDFDATDYIASTKLMVLRANEKIRPLYLYYILQSQVVIDELQMLAESRSGTFPQITFSELSLLTTELPDIDSQDKIINILKSLDDKIELNRRINANLEAQAQALFRSWFVDNDNQLGNYQTKSLTDIAQYLNGLAMQKFPPESIQNSLPVLKIKELGQGLCDASSDRCSTSIKPEYVINDGDVIFSWSGTLLVDVWCGGKCGLNQHLFKVTSDNYPKWFIFYWTKHHLDKFIRIAKDKAVTMGHIKRCDLESSEVKVPKKPILEYLDKIFTPLLDSMITHRIENRKLSALRDTLLPKLMAGEIKI
uniref:restriction endonuclease subunit S n=1 Tax=Alistipes shahii TaxID=328814 RepID=UPI00402A16EF